MSKKRLSDTTAICAPISDNQSLNISVEKIENGYVTRKSHYNDGNYRSCSTFTTEKPNLASNNYDRSSPDTGNAMSRAKLYLERK